MAKPVEPIAATELSGGKLATDHVSASALLDAMPKAMGWIRTTMRAAMRDELTVPQFRILVHLSKRGPLTNGALAERQGVSIAAMSRMVETLVKKGLVDRESSVVDRRALVIAVTPKGLSLFGRSHTAVQRSLAAKISALSVDDQEALARGAALIGGLFDD